MTWSECTGLDPSLQQAGRGLRAGAQRTPTVSLSPGRVPGDRLGPAQRAFPDRAGWVGGPGAGEGPHRVRGLTVSRRQSGTSTAIVLGLEPGTSHRFCSLEPRSGVPSDAFWTESVVQRAQAALEDQLQVPALEAQQRSHLSLCSCGRATRIMTLLPQWVGGTGHPVTSHLRLLPSRLGIDACGVHGREWGHWVLRARGWSWSSRAIEWAVRKQQRSGDVPERLGPLVPSDWELPHTLRKVPSTAKLPLPESTAHDAICPLGR